LKPGTLLALSSESSGLSSFNRLDRFDQDERNHFHPLIRIFWRAAIRKVKHGRSAYLHHFRMADISRPSTVEANAEGDEGSRSNPFKKIICTH
jgi:hypothetical protein